MPRFCPGPHAWFLSGTDVQVPAMFNTVQSCDLFDLVIGGGAGPATQDQA
jgi:hypothetical protein